MEYEKTRCPNDKYGHAIHPNYVCTAQDGTMFTALAVGLRYRHSGVYDGFVYGDGTLYLADTLVCNEYDLEDQC